MYTKQTISSTGIERSSSSTIVSLCFIFGGNQQNDTMYWSFFCTRPSSDGHIFSIRPNLHWLSRRPTSYATAADEDISFAIASKIDRTRTAPASSALSRIDRFLKILQGVVITTLVSLSTN